MRGSYQSPPHLSIPTLAHAAGRGGGRVGSVSEPSVHGEIVEINGDGGAILRSSGRGRVRREWVIKLVGAGAVRRPASGERQFRAGPGGGGQALPIGNDSAP
jgi:hypothetical protein